MTFDVFVHESVTLGSVHCLCISSEIRTVWLSLHGFFTLRLRRACVSFENAVQVLASWVLSLLVRRRRWPRWRALKAAHHRDLSVARGHCSARRVPHKATFDQEQGEERGGDGEIETDERTKKKRDGRRLEVCADGPRALYGYVWRQETQEEKVVGKQAATLNPNKKSKARKWEMKRRDGREEEEIGGQLGETTEGSTSEETQEKELPSSKSVTDPVPSCFLPSECPNVNWF